jgi:hypothetical protein
MVVDPLIVIDPLIMVKVAQRRRDSSGSMKSAGKDGVPI